MNFVQSHIRERDGLVVRASGYGSKGPWFEARSRRSSWPSPHPCIKGVLSIAKGSFQQQTSILSWGWIPPVRLMLYKSGISTESKGLHGSKGTYFFIQILQSHVVQKKSLLYFDRNQGVSNTLNKGNFAFPCVSLLHSENPVIQKEFFLSRSVSKKLFYVIS